MTEQIIYSELEAYAVRWPYLKTEPIDKWFRDDTDKTFNVAQGSQQKTNVEVISSYEKLYTGRKIATKLYSFTHILTDIKLYLEKIGSPSDIKIVYCPARNIGRKAQVPKVYNTDRDSSAYLGVNNTNWYAQTFKPTETINCKRVGFLAALNFAGKTVIVELRTATASGPTNTILATATRTLPSDFPNWWFVAMEFDNPLTLEANQRYALVLYTTSSTGANIPYGSDSYYPDGTVYKSTNSGTSWTAQNVDTWFVIYGEAEIPIPDVNSILYESVLTGVGALNWYSLPKPTDGFDMGEDIFIVLEADGDGVNNYYKVYNGPALNNRPSSSFPKVIVGSMARYENDWMPDGDMLLNLQYGENYTELYTWNYEYPPYRASSTSVADANVRVKANTGTVNIWLSTGGKTIKQSTTSTSYGVRSFTANFPQKKVKIKLLANGDGAADYGEFRPNVLYDKNPVYPRDFFFSEMYLLRVRAEQANTVVRLNDMTSIYLANAGDTFAVGEQFKTPVKKLQVLSGQATCDMLGVV